MHMIPIPIQTRLVRKARTIPDRLLRSFFSRCGEIGQATIIRDVGVDKKASWDGVLWESLNDVSPAIRRNAAWSIGCFGSASAAHQLLQYAVSEPCDTVRFEMVLAAQRCGAGADESFAILEAQAVRKMFGAYGPRTTGGLSSWDLKELRELWPLAQPVSNTSDDPAGMRLDARAQIGANRDDRRAVVVLALMRHPDDVPFLNELWIGAGRRMRLTLCRAMGLHGDPHFIGRLLNCLGSVDVDPGHGFAMRKEAAVAIGRLGFRTSQNALIRALENEAMDFEGRPGAGLGIQHPVRSHILSALGELQAGATILHRYLGNTHGSADGGFYLPAMDALWKCGDTASLAGLMDESDLVAANALGVIRAISGPDAVRSWINDSRPMVARVASAESV